MEIRLTPGRKADGDKVIWVRTLGQDGWEALTLRDIGEVVRLWCENEARIYSGANHDGGGKVITFLRDCWLHGVESAARHHKLPAREAAEVA